MPTCPICVRPLEVVRHREGVYHRCPGCDGRALTISQLRRTAGDPPAVKVLRLIKYGRRRGDRRCPFCGRPMLEFSAPDPPMQFDACRPCSVVWLDAPTYAALPEGIAETTSSLPAQSAEALGVGRLKEMEDSEAEERKRSRRKNRPR